IIDVTLANQLDITHVDIVRQFAWEKEVITIMVRGMTEDADQEPDLRDSTIVLSRELAKRGIWPAIDSQQSSSVLFENNLISEEHKQVMHAVKQILCGSDACQKQAPANLSPEDLRTIHRAQRINLFFTQPFAIAEQFAGRPRAYLTMKQTITDFK